MSNIDETLKLLFVNSQLFSDSFETVLRLRQLFLFVVIRYQFTVIPVLRMHVANSFNGNIYFTYMFHFAVVRLENPHFHIYCSHQHNVLCCLLAGAALLLLDLLGKQQMIEQMEHIV